MSQDSQQTSERTELPIERGFPIERVNEIADKEGRAKQWYRPTYTMHKWWARRLGCVFRTISLYTLLDNPEKIKISEPGNDKESLSDWGEQGETTNIASILDRVDLSNPESLWQLYPKDVTVGDKKILDPFMGGGTSLIEASRFGTEVVGNDLNPVAWFISKKELEAGKVASGEIEQAFEQVKEDVANEITQYYKTACPNGDHNAEVMYYQWVKELNCTSCNNTIPLFNDYRVGKARYEDGKYDVLCPGCETVIRVDDWQSECHCGDCGNLFTPSEGNVSRGNYTCTDCGQKYGIVDAIDEQNGFGLRLYALEYYCPVCKEEGRPKGEIKGYEAADEHDQSLYRNASNELENNSDLEEYIPNTEIPLGIMTDSTQFEGSIGGGHNLLRHGYEDWRDLYNDRQLLCLSKLLKSIDNLENQQVKEFLLLAFSDSLSYSTMLTHYQYSRNHIDHIFSTNSFDAPQEPTENNVWGAEQGAGSFRAMFDMVQRGVEYANAPTERYISDGETVETNKFKTLIGQNTTVTQGDARDLDFDSEFDAVLTDPPYYDNVIYSEISNYYYVWLRLALSGEYEEFDSEFTPGSESIVANPAQGKGSEEFEEDLKESFKMIRKALKEDGVLAFTYHHSDSESWGELLSALCDVDFEITAAYPVNADLAKHGAKIAKGDSVSFDIIVVARPIEGRQSISWNQLRRNIYRTARQVRRRLEQSDRDLSRGDIGVIEMGRCFQEYSKHHGKVQRGGEIMSAKEVVEEIYGIIQEASEIGVEDVFIDLLDSRNPSFDDVNKLCRGTNATPKELKEMCLYNQDDGFKLGTWDNEKRQAYIQERVNGDGGEHLSNLDKLQFLRYRYQKGQAVQNYVDKWGVDDDLRELAGRLADVTGDDTYTRVLGDRDITSY